MLTPDAYRLRAGVPRAADGTGAARRGRGGLCAAGGRAGARPARARRPRVQLSRRMSHVRSQADRPRYGSYTHFCSNAAAAWSSAALDRIGGFKPTLVSEETIAVGRAAGAGERIAYVAEAVVDHAHRLGPACRLPPPVRHRLQPPPVRLAAARARGRSAARAALRAHRSRPGAARGAGGAAADAGAFWRRAGSATAPACSAPAAGGPGAPRRAVRTISGPPTSDPPAAARCRAGLSRHAPGLPHQQPLPAARGGRPACVRGGPPAAAARPRRSPSSPAGSAFARWRESSVAGLRVRHYPHYPLQPFHHALARTELAGWLRRRRRRCRPAARPSAAAAAPATDLPMVATFHSPMLADTGAIAEPGLRPALIKANALLFSRRYEQWYLDHAAQTGRRLGRRAPRAGGDLSAERAAADRRAQRRRRRLLRLRPAQVAAGRRSSMSAGWATAKGCSGCSTPSPGCRAELGRELILAGEGPLEAALRRPGGRAGHRRPGPLRGLPRPHGRAQRAARRRLLRQPGRLRDRPVDRARGHGLRHPGGEHRTPGSPSSSARGRRSCLARPDSQALATAAIAACCATPDSPRRGPARPARWWRPRFDWEQAVDRLEAIYGAAAGAGRMIRARPVPSPARRFAVLCPGFAADRVRRQPWHVADGLARGLFAALGHEVRLFTDRRRPRLRQPLPGRDAWNCSSRGRPTRAAPERARRGHRSTGCSWSPAPPSWHACGRFDRSVHRSRW